MLPTRFSCVRYGLQIKHHNCPRAGAYGKQQYLPSASPGPRAWLSMAANSQTQLGKHIGAPAHPLVPFLRTRTPALSNQSPCIQNILSQSDIVCRFWQTTLLTTMHRHGLNEIPPPPKPLPFPVQMRRSPPGKRPTQPGREAEGQDLSPSGSSRWAMKFIIGINVLITGAWTYAVWFEFLLDALASREPASDLGGVETEDTTGPAVSNKHKSIQRMIDHTTLSLRNIEAHRYWTLVTSGFSNSSLLWPILDMVTLRVLSKPVHIAGGVAGIGAFHVIGLAFGSAVFAGLTDIAYRRNGDPKQATSGAHGIIMTFVVASACLRPFHSILGHQRPFIRQYHLAIFFFVLNAAQLGNGSGDIHHIDLAGAVWGILYYLVALRKFGNVSQALRMRR